MSIKRLLLACGVAGVAVFAVPAAGARTLQSSAAGAISNISTTGPVGNTAVLPSGRLVTPVGVVSNLGDYPLGVAVSPDGRLSVAINSGQGSGLNGGSGLYCSNQGTQNCRYNPPEPLLTATQGYSNTRTEDQSLTVTDLRTGRTHEVKAVPTQYNPSGPPSFNQFYIGLTFSPDGRHLYASGGQNDAVYDFPVRRDIVAPRPVKTIILPDTVKKDSQVPSYGAGNACTQGLAVTPDGRYIIVAHKFENTVNIVDARTYASTQVALSAPSPSGGAYPYGVVVSPRVVRANGVTSYTAYVSEEGTNSVAQIMISGGMGVLENTIAVGDHPTGMAMAPDGAQVYVANADDDTLSIISTLTNQAAQPALTLHAFGDESLGSTPNAVAVSPDGQRIYVALAGDDGVAVLGTASSFTSGATGSGRRATVSPSPASLIVGGMIPTGWYPSGVAVSPDGRTVYISSAKGLGSRYPDHPEFGASVPQNFYYDGNNMPGILQTVRAPALPALRTGLTTVQQDITFATNADATRGDHNPIPATGIDATAATSLTVQPPTPIKYVVEIVRENRTFDQILGDLPANQGRNQPGTDTVNAEPNYAILGKSHTPNDHALVGDPVSAPTQAFAGSDNFYSDGEASVQGHYWTAAANVNDYVEKTWRNYYGPRPTFNDTVSPVSTPRNCTIFQSALLRQVATAASLTPFTFRDYGELLGIAGQGIQGVNGISTFQSACTNIPNGGFSLAASSQLTLTQDDRKTAAGFLSDVGLNMQGQVVTPTSSLKNFSYVIMGEDHTNAFVGALSPRAYIAQNDAGVGMVISALSRSKYWPQTAVFVMEDDSQDGIDHVDGHRNVLFVASPYAKHVGNDGKPGYIGHIHYSQASVLKTIEMILGLPYLSTYDQNASPLYDLFQNKDGSAGYDLTPSDKAFYDVQPAPSFIDETYAQIKASVGTAMADTLIAESRRLDLSAPDRAGPMLEIIQWQLERPHQAVPAQLIAKLQAWNAAHGHSRDGD